MTRSWMPETNTTPAGLAPEVSADATSTEPLLMPTSTAFWPCDAALATAAAASEGDVVSTVRKPAALKRASLRTMPSMMLSASAMRADVASDVGDGAVEIRQWTPQIVERAAKTFGKDHVGPLVAFPDFDVGLAKRD